jgi:tape measure domain-containing protein
MAVQGSLTVEMELDDDQFTTRVTRSGTALKGLESQIMSVISASGKLDTAVGSNAQNLALYTVALGSVGNAIENLRHVFTDWIEDIVEVNSKIETTVALLRGMSQAADDAGKIKDATSSFQSLVTLAGTTPFGLDALTTGFVKLRAAGVTPTLDTMKALTDSVAAFGGNDQNLNRATYALQEMAGRGVVSLTQLQRQLGQDIPGSVELMARAMNLTVAQLHAAVTKGTLEAKNAIQQLAGEMERTYGGAAVARLNTFVGAMAQFRTQWMQIQEAAGGLNDGVPQQDGFYESVVKGVQQLTAALKSPEAMAAAITVNNTLAEMTQKIEQLAEVMMNWGGTIVSVGGYLLTFWAAMKAGTVAIEALSGAAALLGSTTLANLAGGAITAGRALASFAAPAVTAFMEMNATILGVSAGLEGVEAVAVGLVAPMAAFAASFAVLAAPVGILAGIGLIIYKLQDMKGIAEQTGDAIRRIGQGDLTEGNQSKAAQEIQDLTDKVQRAKELVETLNSVQNPANAGKTLNSRQSRTLSTDIGGFDGSPAIKSPFGDMSNFGGVSQKDTEAYANAAIEQYNALSLKLENATRAIQSVGVRRIQSMANTYAQTAIESLEASMSALHNQYRIQMTNLDAERAKLTPQEQKGPENTAINAQSAGISDNLYKQEAASVQQMIDQEKAAIIEGGKTMSAQEAANHDALLTQLEAFLKKVNDDWKTAAEERGQVVTLEDSKNFDKAEKAAATFIENTKEQIASLQGSMDGTGSVLAKLNQALAEGGKFAALNGAATADLVDSMRKLATQLDETKAAKKTFDAEMKAETVINNGIDKATADIAAYSAKLKDPELPEAQRSLQEQQARIGEQMAIVAQNAMAAQGPIAGLVTIMENLANVNAAQNLNNFASALRNLTIEQGKANQARLKGLTGGARANEEKNQINRRADSIKGQFDSTPDDLIAKSGFTREQLEAQLADAQNQQIAGANRVASNAGAKAAKPGQNEIDSLTGRLAELKSQVTGTRGEYEKFLAIFQQDPKYMAGQRESILAIAKEIDTYTAAVEKAHAAQQAISTLKSNVSEAQDAVNLTAQLNSRGKMLDIEKQIYEYRLSQDKEVTKVATQPAVDGHSQADIDAQVGQAKILDEQAVTEKTLALVQERMAAYRTETKTIQEQSADGTAARRQAGDEELQFEHDRMSKLIQDTQQSDEQKKKMEDDLDNYIAAKRQDLDTKTENALEKLGDNWGKVNDNMSQFTAEFVSKVSDSFVTLETTGKNTFSSIAQWAIQQLLSIVQHEAFSELIKMFEQVANPSGGTTGAGGIIGAIQGLLGIGGETASLTGNGASIGSSATGLPAATSIGGLGYHSGGLYGEPTFTRNLSPSVFAGAPRFHTGIGPDEYAAVLQKGEGVFTAGQMAAIGDMNHSYTAVEGAMTAMSKAVTAPANVGPSSYSRSGTSYGPSSPNIATSSGSGKGGVAINVTNPAGTKLNATAGTPRFDGEQMIVDVVMKHANTPGPLRSMFKGGVS